MKVYGKENCRTESEKLVFEWLQKVDSNKLKNKLSFGVASYRPETPFDDDSEIDFVLVGEAGILVLEVKGGIISIENGIWHQNKRTLSRSPFVQALDNYYDLWRFLNKNGFENSKFGYYACVFPHMVVNESMDPSIPSLLYFDKRFPISPESFIDGVFEYSHQKFGKKFLDQSTVERLEHFMVPTKNNYVRDMATYTDDAIIELGDEQLVAIEALSDVKRMVIDGPPGSGKTVIALEILKQKDQEGVKTVYVCYNKALKNKVNYDIEKKLGHIPKHIDIRTHEDLKGIAENTYEFAVLDEAQDYLDIEMIEPVDKVLRGGLDTGSFRIFLDANQDIFNKVDDEFLDGLIDKDTVVPYHLRYNYRNSSSIIFLTELATGLKPGISRNNPKGLKVTIHEIPYKDGSAGVDFPAYNKSVSQVINNILSEGFEPKDIMILTSRPLNYSSLSPSHISNIRIKNGVKLVKAQDVDWSNDLNNQGIIYGSPWILKGVDAKVVVCLDIYEKVEPKELLVCLTRARSLLILFADKSSFYPKIKKNL